MKKQNIQTAKIAVIHDWLDGNFGAEKVLKEILELFPRADIFSLVDFMSGGDKKFLKEHKITTSFIQHIPFAKRRFRLMLPLFPFAIKSFKLESYDLVISSSHAVAKGISISKEKHICYIHTPIRYAYDMQNEYFIRHNYRGIKKFLAKFFLNRLKKFDQKNDNVGLFIANSTFVAKRVEDFYNRKSVVINPPANTNFFNQTICDKQDYFVTCSRLVPYKNIEFLISCMKENKNEKLYIIGGGPDEERLKEIAPANVIFLGKVNDQELKTYLSNAKAFLYAAIEDFGIVMVESLASGTPVIAYKKGGALDIVNSHTGILFDELTQSSFKEAITIFQNSEFKSSDLKLAAEKFSGLEFKRKMLNEIHSFYDNQ